MELQLIITFIGAATLLALMPGPDNIFVLTESLTKGYKTGIAISLGLSLGVLVHTSLAATGLSIIIQKSELAFKVIKYLGATYMIYLAIIALKDKQGSVELQAGKKRPLSLWRLIRKGFLMNVLNPKVTLFFVAFLPQFVSKTGIRFSFQMLILGAIFMINSFIIFSIIAKLSGSLSSYLNSERFWKYTKIVKAMVLFSLGMWLLLAEK